MLIHLIGSNCRKQLPPLSKAGGKGLKVEITKRPKLGRGACEDTAPVSRRGSSAVGGVGVTEESVMPLAVEALEKLQTTFSG